MVTRWLAREDDSKERDRGWLVLLVILICLLAHVVGGIVFFVYDMMHAHDAITLAEPAPVPVTFIPPTPEPQPAPEVQKPEEQPESSDVAALRPRESRFGATDEEGDEPDFKTVELAAAAVPPAEQPVQEPQKVQEEEAATADQPEPTHVAPDLEDKPREEVTAAPVAEVAIDQPDRLAAHKGTIDTESAREKADRRAGSKPRDEVPLKKAQQRMAPKQAALQPGFIGEGMSLAEPTPPGTAQRNISPQKKLTFADLAQGFLDTLADGGQDWTWREGREDLRPNDYDLKLQSYMNKLQWQVQANLKQYLASIKPPSRHVRVGLIFEIGKQGDLVSLGIYQASGVAEIDRLVTKAFREAAPFPPVPDHLNMQVLKLRCGYIVISPLDSSDPRLLYR